MVEIEKRDLAVTEFTECPLCSSNNFNNIYTGWDDRYGQPDLFEVEECSNCSLVFLKQVVKKEEIANLYEKYYPHENDRGIITKHPRLHELFNKIGLRSLAYFLMRSANIALYVRKGESVLDVGCGPGYNAELVQRKNGQWTGVEVDLLLSESCKKNGLKCFNGTIEDFALTTGEKFDTILLSQILEHVYAPLDFINVCKSLLKPYGRIILASPNYGSVFRKKYQPNWLHMHIPYHLYQYNRRSIEFLAKKTGLKIQQFKTITPSNWFLCQSKLRPVERGKINPTFCLNFNIFKQLILFPYLYIIDSTKQGDILIVELCTDDAA
jgi:2-polyprenyl-3-methyl-5-hydroxy-6-metoxy-1,4-benzoquinol methylase